MEIQRVHTDSPLYPTEIWELREQVLRLPLGLSLRNEDLSRDHTNEIFVALDAGKVVGCVFMEPKDYQDIQLRAMAVYPQYQGKGIGRQLVRAAEDFARTAGYRRILLHARKVAMGFYQSMQYTPFGEEFIEVGIRHYEMEKRFSA